jgi:hypothetical protein
MKKLILSFSALASLSLQAQNPITITSSDLPAIGSSFVNIQELNFEGIYPGDPGENQVYDISGFQNNGEDSIYFLNPAQTSYAADFENSTISRYLATDSTYVFMIEGETKLEIDGLVLTVPISTEKGVAKASDPLTQLTLPMAYEAAFDDDAAFSTNSMYYHMEISPDPYTYFDSVRLNITYDRSSLVDGWGILVTPFGDFSVLRQNVYDITVYSPEFYMFYVDTIFGTPVTIPLGWQEIPGAEVNDTTTTYFYLANTDYGNPMILAELQENANGGIISAQYAKLPGAAAIEELSLSNVFVFPNPAADHVDLKSPFLLNSVRMLGTDGKEVFSAEINNNTATIDLSAYAAGIYTLIIDTEKGQELKRVNKL